MATTMMNSKAAATKPAAIHAPKSKLVYAFAAWGLLMVVTGLYAWGQWIASSDFKPSPMGADPLPNQVYWTLRITEVVAVSCAGLLLWKFMIKPWRREGRITWDGMFMIAGFLTWWTDPIDNYFNFTFMYNSGFYNMASWTAYIPGWEAPNQQLFPEPLFFVGGLYIWWFITPVAAGCWVLKQMYEKKPHWSLATKLTVMFTIFGLFDFVAENIFQRLEIFKYVGTYAPLTVWAGTEHQYPIYNCFMMAAFFLGMTCLRYFKDDKGYAFCERGIDQIKASGVTKTILRQFAVIGALGLNIGVFYYTPFLLFSMKADSFPKYPSYLMAEICGKGTPYACPSAEVPIPRRNSLAITPDDHRLSAEATKN